MRVFVNVASEGLSNALILVIVPSDLINRLVEAFFCLCYIATGLLDVLVEVLGRLLLTYLFTADFIWIGTYEGLVFAASKSRLVPLQIRR